MPGLTVHRDARSHASVARRAEDSELESPDGWFWLRHPPWAREAAEWSFSFLTRNRI